MRILTDKLGRILQPVRSRVPYLDLQHHEYKILVLLSVVISALVGLVVVAFVAVTEHLGRALITTSPWARLLTPILGSLVGGILLYKFFPDARGSGIPQTRVALLLQRGVILMRTVIGKFVCSSISLASGVALGREGPSVQIGAGIASATARRLGLSQKSVQSLIPVGTAAAVAAAFNTPLAAILFTLEEVLADLHAGVTGVVVLGAATSWIVLRLILGDEPLFHVPAYQLVHPVEFLIYAVLGLLGGLISVAFVKLLLHLRAIFLRVPSGWRPFAPATGGLVVGLIALVVPGVLGVGYNLVGDALNGQLALKMMLILLAVKIIGTTTSYSSGNAGGIFGPSLFIGAMLGGAVGQIAHSLLPDHTGNSGAYALVGMGAAFAGIIRTPMTSVIMIFELTRDYTIIVPLMIANLCSYFLSQRLQRSPIYEALSRQEGITMPSAAHWPEPVLVEQAMRPHSGTLYSAASPHVHPDHPLDVALQRMAAANLDELPVLSRVGGLQIGALSTGDVWTAYQALAVPRSEPAMKVGRNWLPMVAITTLTVVLVVSGLFYWQRLHRSKAGLEAFHEGQHLMEQGRVEEAVGRFRIALAQDSRDAKRRSALGLALVETGHLDEAYSYLTGASESDPSSAGPWLGLAKIAQARGEQALSLDLYSKAFSKAWSATDEALRYEGEFDYAKVLAEAGHKNEAVSRLLNLIGQKGNDPSAGKQAGEAIEKIGAPEQAEASWTLLSTKFPADDAVWRHLGDVRFAQGKDSQALEAYRRAGAKDAVVRSEDVLRLDPTRPGLSVQDRAKRWDAILQRVVDGVGTCAPSPELDEAKPLLTQHSSALRATDEKMKAALQIWQTAPAACKKDAALNHIFAKVNE